MTLKTFLAVIYIYTLGCVQQNNNPMSLALIDSSHFDYSNDTTLSIKLINKSSFKSPGFNRVPLLGISFEGNIFVRKNYDNLSVLLDKKMRFFTLVTLSFHIYYPTRIPFLLKTTP